MGSSKEISFSVITATFNRACFLERLANSLLDQLPYIAEWIVIDDGSIDDTKEVIAKLSSMMPFRVLYKYHQNKGQLHSVNIALSEISSDYFFKIDSDDYLLPNAIEHIADTVQLVTSKYESSEVYA